MQKTLPCLHPGCEALATGGIIDRDECVVHRGKIDRWPLTEDDRREQREKMAAAAEARAAKNKPKAVGRQPPPDRPAAGNRNEDLLDPGRWN